VRFDEYAESFVSGDHNVVADDGAFRCARGCDGEGGDGTPVSGFSCNARTGSCFPDATLQMVFTLQFNVPGIVNFHDEVGGATGVIIVTPLTFGGAASGAWYDPAQSGHGFSLEVLAGPPQQLLAYWFTFAPQGEQSWIAALGPIDGNRAVLQGVQTVGTGARFPPNFEQPTLASKVGTLTFTFSDCNHGMSIPPRPVTAAAA
jgi:hypothetical protein